MIIDTDMGSDDWLAILFLLNCETISIQAITVTGAGMSHIDSGFQNLSNLTLFAGHPKIMVAIGRDSPLEGKNVFPDNWRERSDRFLEINLPKNNAQSSQYSAVDAIIDTVRRKKQKIKIVALGPLTNLAEVIQRDNAILEYIEMLYIMGGALNVPGNAPNQHAEWNFYVDPLAASLVLSSGVNITLIPLDATNKVPVTIEFYERLRREKKTKIAKLVFDILTAEMDELKIGEYFFWDSLAAAVAIDTGFVTIERLPIGVIEKTEDDGQGKTVISPNNGHVINVCTGVDLSAFETLFIKTINKTQFG